MRWTGDYNPEQDSDKLGLVQYAMDEPNLSYEFNCLIFWVTQEGHVYCASDSG
jgi:hypothetical protein